MFDYTILKLMLNISSSLKASILSEMPFFLSDEQDIVF